MLTSIKGKRTYVGLVIVLLGLMGANKLFLPEQIAELADVIVQLLGLTLAAYGRYQATK